MSQWLVFTGTSKANAIAQFNVLNASLDTAFGYPTQDGKTLTYAQPIAFPAPTALSFSVAMPIESRCLPFLTPAQTSSLKTLDALFQAGWFIEPTDPAAKKISASTSVIATSIMAQAEAMPADSKKPSGLWWKLAAGAAAAATIGAALYHYLG